MNSEISRRAILAAAVAAPAACLHRRSTSADNLPEMTGSEALALIKDGSLTSEAYAAALLRLRSAADDVNALSWLNPDAVLEQARAADLARASGKGVGVLAGLPVVVKDNINTVGFSTSAGTALLKNLRPTTDAPVVAALFREGAILLGKTNMHELAGGGTSNNPVFGPVRNPYDRKRVAGGSSGGTAAAVSLRFAPVGLGTDTAGSVRIPASFCGLAGLRPTTAGAVKLYPDDGIVPLALALDTAGPIARSVADLALIHGAIVGERPPPPAPLRGVRIGLPIQHYWADLDPEVERVARSAIERLSDAGVKFVAVDISDYIERAQQVFGAMFMAGMRDDLDRYFHRHGEHYTRADVVAQIESRDTLALFERASQAPVSDISSGTRTKLLTDYHDALKKAGVEAICFPTVAVPAPLIRVSGDGPDDKIAIGGREVSEGMTLPRNTVPACGLGVPGLTLPAGLTVAGQPVGIELDGPAGSDLRLLALGEGFEAVLGHLAAPPKSRAGA